MRKYLNHYLHSKCLHINACLNMILITFSSGIMVYSIPFNIKPFSTSGRNQLDDSYMMRSLAMLVVNSFYC